MSFGFSVGDFIAVGKLIGEITSSLQTIGGAKSEYQELIREFDSLHTALRSLDQLENKNSTPNKLLDSIKCAALSCRYPLEDFLAKVKKYEASLGQWRLAHTGKSVADKLRWSFGEKDDIRRLQTYLHVHIGTINMLLLEHGLQRMDTQEKKAGEEALQVRQQLDSTNSAVKDVVKSSASQHLMLHAMQSMLGNLCRVVSGEVQATLRQVSQVVNRVCVSTQQIYAVVLEIRESVTAVDTRWTYFQAPLAIEDARGSKFPFPAEYDLSLLDTIIRDRFRSGPGASDVREGNYELCRTKRRSEQITSASRLLPGTEIIMAVIIPTPEAIDAVCPIRRCGSTEINGFPGGGFTCGICCVWFDQATKERQRIEEVIDSDNNDTKDCQSTGSTANDTDHKEMHDSDNQGTDGLRNVRWSVEQAEPEPEPELEPDWSAGMTEQQKNIEKHTKYLAQQHRVALNNASFVDGDSPVTSPGSSVDNDTRPFASSRPRSRKPAIKSGRAPSGDHALEDYQMQLMLLEQQNKKRLLMQRIQNKGLAENAGEGRRRKALIESDILDDMFPDYARAGHNAPPSGLEGLAKQSSLTKWRSLERFGRHPPLKATILNHIRRVTNSTTRHNDSDFE